MKPIWALRSALKVAPLNAAAGRGVYRIPDRFFLHLTPYDYSSEESLAGQNFQGEFNCTTAFKPFVQVGKEEEGGSRGGY